MNCKKNLCHRSKNIQASGNCNVCDDVIKALETQNNNNKKPREIVSVDMKLMLETHEKLSKGAAIDPKVVSGLLLSGVINILIQHDTIENLEIESRTTKIRLDMLENWIIKQDETLKELTNNGPIDDVNNVTVDKSNNLENLLMKVAYFESLVKDLKPTNKKNQQKLDNYRSKVIKCDQCHETFEKNCDLEHHMEDHEKAKEHKCDVCRKEFFLRWRLKKHMKVHTDEAQFCHFFNNEKDCPYELIGCMFKHERSGKCGEDACI